MLVNQQAATLDHQHGDDLQAALHHIATAIGVTTAVLFMGNPANIPGPSLLFGFASACLFGYKIVRHILYRRSVKLPWDGIPGLLAISFASGSYVTVIVIGFFINYPHLVP